MSSEDSDTAFSEAQGQKQQKSGLLPSGLSDVLYPQSEQNDHARMAVMSAIAQFGYQRVSPPLVEFEETLVDDVMGASLSTQTFRLLDPISRRMMGVRADMTAQTARISGTRLAHLPRPLRLAYHGDVLRVVPELLNPARQMAQAGAEIIGRDDDDAALEIILVGITALKAASIGRLTVDLSLPQLGAIIGAQSGQPEMLAELVGRRDLSALADSDQPEAGMLADILQASGNDIDRLKAVASGLPADVASQLERLTSLAEQITSLDDDISVTLDPLDRQGDGYHTSIGFAIYGMGSRGAIAAGGAYVTPYQEPAIGLSIYMERVQRILPAPPAQSQLYIAASAGPATALKFIRTGRRIIMGSPDANPDQEARNLGCRFIVRSAQSEPEQL
jgi:ATP phosphoribosyltransferase regulatory subunit